MERSLLNLGILAHVDAGKTTLTERLLFEAGVIAAPGSVDAGTTQTDTLALERQRGITIKAAVVSFPLGDDLTVNLVDTPGHPDFIAEVERALGVLDGAVLVVSAVEGVQSQTRILWRALDRLRVPTIFFVNKTDRMGADHDRVHREIREWLTPRAVRPDDVEGIAELDEETLSAYVEGRPVDISGALRRLHAVFSGSALTGEGVGELSVGIADLLRPPDPDPDGELAATVFKIERGRQGEKVAYARLFAGKIHTRDIVLGEKVTALAAFTRGGAESRQVAYAGEIAQLWGLSRARIGDAVGSVPRSPSLEAFARPIVETVVEAPDRHALKLALMQLAEQDPLIDVRQDESGTLSLSLYGEVQTEVVAATLAADFGLPAEFRETTLICVERPAGVGESLEVLHTETNPFDATLGFRIEPAPPDSGIAFRLAVGASVSPLHLYGKLELFGQDMERCARETLGEGLYGWQVTDCVVTLTQTAYGTADGPPSKRASTTQRDFRLLAPLVLMQALREAGVVVCEPFVRVDLDVPEETLGSVLALVGRLGGTGEAAGESALVARLSAGRLHDLQRQLPALTSGLGVLEAHPDGYRPLPGDPPVRRRTRPSPLNRKEYLRSLRRS